MSYNILIYPPYSPPHLQTYESSHSTIDIINMNCIPDSIIHMCKIFFNNKLLDPSSLAISLDELISPQYSTGIHTLTIHPLLVGGKGGFGNNLRSGMIKRKNNQPIDHSAMRDLQGRRLIDIQNAQALQEWARVNEVDPRRITVNRTNNGNTNADKKTITRPNSSQSHPGPKPPKLNSFTAVSQSTTIRDSLEIISSVTSIDSIADVVKAVHTSTTTSTTATQASSSPTSSSPSPISSTTDSIISTKASTESKPAPIKATAATLSSSSYGLGLDFSSSDDDDDDDDDASDDNNQ